jgi:hypothetical protein
VAVIGGTVAIGPGTGFAAAILFVPALLRAATLARSKPLSADVVVGVLAAIAIMVVAAIPAGTIFFYLAWIDGGDRARLAFLIAIPAAGALAGVAISAAYWLLSHPSGRPTGR